MTRCFFLFLFLINAASARIGETLEECTKRYVEISHQSTFENGMKYFLALTPEMIHVKLFFIPKIFGKDKEAVYICCRIQYTSQYQFSKEDLLQLVAKNFPEKKMPVTLDKIEKETVYLIWENSRGDKANGFSELKHNNMNLECFSADYFNYKALHE